MVCFLGKSRCRVCKCKGTLSFRDIGERAYTNQIDKRFGSFPIGRLPVRDSRFHDNTSDGIPRLMAVFWFVKSDEFPGGIVPLISITIPRDEKIYDSLQGMVILHMEWMPWICASKRAMQRRGIYEWTTRKRNCCTLRIDNRSPRANGELSNVLYDFSCSLVSDARHEGSTCTFYPRSCIQILLCYENKSAIIKSDKGPRL